MDEKNRDFHAQSVRGSRSDYYHNVLYRKSYRMVDLPDDE